MDTPPILIDIKFNFLKKHSKKGVLFYCKKERGAKIMKIELSYIISLTSVIIAVITVLTNNGRSLKQEASGLSAKLTEMTVRLEIIGNNITEIKADLKNVRSEVKNNSQEIITLKNEMEHLKGRVDIYEQACKDCRKTNNLK